MNAYYYDIGRTELTKRPDGRWNVWRWMFAFCDDIVPSWVLIGVVRKPRQERG